MSDAFPSITLDTWRRVRFPIEIAIAIIYLLILLGTQINLGGWPGLLAEVLMASTIVLHRIRPAIALGISAVVVAGLWTFGYGGGTPSLVLWLPLALVLFGSSAYGSPVTRWVSLVIPFAVIVAVAAGTYSAFGYYSGMTAWVVNYALMSLVYGAVAFVPWAVGAVVRAQSQRVAAETSQKVTVARLGAVVGEAALAEERNRVAREVHDIVAHSLAVVIAQADGAQAIAGKSPAGVRDSLQVISSTARGALADIRVLLTELRHSQDLTPQPGLADIDELIAGFQESGLTVVRTDFGTPVDPSPAAQLTVYRILQEALTNALRHGANAPVDLEFEWTDTDLEMTVTNQTAPATASAPVVDPDATGAHDPVAGGHGVAGMRERAILAGGRFAAHAGAGGRFRVRVGLPLERELSAVG